MLREILRDNIDQLLLTVSKIGRAFDIISDQYVDKDDLREIKRLIHSLKGNLQAIGLHDDAELAKELEAFVFNFIDSSDEQELHIPKIMVDDWFTKLNDIEFNLKSYLF
jgi:chemotaxis protein histidine kinase CheA